MKTLLLILVTAIATFTLTCGIYKLTENKHYKFKGTYRPLVDEYAEDPEPNTDNLDCTLTIQDRIEWREAIKYDRYIDSIYLHMPESALIEILSKLGSYTSDDKVVEEYLNNINKYNNSDTHVDTLKESKGKEMTIDTLVNVSADTLIIN